MSEPIQSIAQNNYILHNIDAKKLYVQEPLFTANSGDAVYVGWRPDETVLFETTALNVSAVSLSEPLSSFERFRLYPYQAGAGYFNYGEFDYDNVRTLATGNNIRLLYSRAIGGNNPFQLLYGDYTLSNDTKSITATSGARRWFPASTGAGGSDSNNTYIMKIVGINRKENA